MLRVPDLGRKTLSARGNRSDGKRASCFVNFQTKFPSEPSIAFCTLLCFELKDSLFRELTADVYSAVQIIHVTCAYLTSMLEIVNSLKFPDRCASDCPQVRRRGPRPVPRWTYSPSRGGVRTLCRSPDWIGTKRSPLSTLGARSFLRSLVLCVARCFALSFRIHCGGYPQRTFTATGRSRRSTQCTHRPNVPAGHGLGDP